MDSLVDTGHTVPTPQQPLTTIHVPHLEGIEEEEACIDL